MFLTLKIPINYSILNVMPRTNFMSMRTEHVKYSITLGSDICYMLLELCYFNFFLVGRPYYILGMISHARLFLFSR